MGISGYDLSSARVPEASGGKRHMIKRPVHASTPFLEIHHHMLPPGSLVRSPQEEWKLSTVVSGDMGSCHKESDGNTVPLFTWFLSIQLMQMVKRTVGQGTSYSSYTNLELPGEMNFRARIEIMLLQSASLPGAACNSEIHVSFRMCCRTLKKEVVTLSRVPPYPNPSRKAFSKQLHLPNSNIL